MSWRLCMMLAGALTGLGACSVGNGVGAAKGSIFELGCNKNGNYSYEGVEGSEGAFVPYDLDPTFFAGEPIDDLRNYSKGTDNMVMSNRLTIRLQRSGKQIELNDVLTFDVSSTYEVGRCVRGHVTDDGKNDWDEKNCFRASPEARGRLRVQWDSYVKASLTLGSTCTAQLVASAVSSPVPSSYSTVVDVPVDPSTWTSWVEFEQFGSAARYDMLPVDRGEVGGHFKVDFGERIYATSFRLTLEDDSVVNAAIHDRPRPTRMIGGELGGDGSTGRFDFDLERGQSAQFFP